METTLLSLCVWAIGISFIHTASGPDHYLPIIVLSKSRKWTLPKTILLTLVCGFGHVMSSLVIGFLAVLLGWNLDKITWFQGIQGNVAGWVLLLFGLVYLVYGIRCAYISRPHKHFEVVGEDLYVLEHTHGTHGTHGTVTKNNKRVRVTPFVLFAVFVMGPSEPLAPILFFSSVKRSSMEIITIASVFTLTTMLTMLAMVVLGLKGFGVIKTEKLERYVHLLGGLVVSICATGMLFFNW